MRFVTCHGISGSGKSTWARKWVGEQPNRVEVNRDTLRKRFVESSGGTFSWRKWNWKNEDKVTEMFWDLVREASNLGQDVVCSDTNLNLKRVAELIKRAKTFGYTEFDSKFFPVTIEEAWARDAARDMGVGHSVIAQQWETSLAIPELHPGLKRWTPNPELTQSCILVDIDGTLAHMDGKRGAFDWKNVGVDSVDEHVRDLVNAYKFLTDNGAVPQDFFVIVLSGRDAICRPETEEWLRRHNIRYDCLFMRKEGDMRKDTFVKEEIFWNEIAHKYNVRFVIDDRPSVARKWRDIGIKTFQVGNPHVEF